MNFSEDRLTVSTVQIKDSLPIPVDIVIMIFSRLPAKSVARFRFLSKFWSDVIRSQYFIDLFAVNSSAQPQILFVNTDETGLSFFSAHQPSDNSFDNISPTHLSHYQELSKFCYYGVPVNDMVCLTKYLCGMCMPLLYNPTSGESLTLPIVKTYRMKTYRENKIFLGYDPTEKQFKVLSLNYDYRLKEDGGYEYFLENEVLTFETEELSWRMIECSKSYYPITGEICINGVLYYRARCASFVGLLIEVIVCFHLRTETFSFINVMEFFNKERLPWKTSLINYDGKLGLLIPEKSNTSITIESIGFELWVLKDAEKHEWSKHVCIFPPGWKDVFGEIDLRFAGMIGTTEIVLSSCCSYPFVHGPPDIFSYNIKKNIIRRLNVQGKEASKLKQVDIFLNYVEDLSLYKLLN